MELDVLLFLIADRIGQALYLDGVEIGLLVQEHVDDFVSAFGVVEVDEQRPVEEPSALMDELPLGVERVRVDVDA